MRHTIGLLALAAGAAAVDNGLGLKPPMGWRTWNAYGGDVSQDKMQQVMDAMVAKKFTVEGQPMSLSDLGYITVGLDDNWQACGTGYMGSFHDVNGNPLVNTTTFPSMKNMTGYGHARGLKVGWYMNNCICAEHEFGSNASYVEKHMQQSVAALAAYEFDGVKLDDCGEFHNLTWWAQLLNQTGRPIMIENCHWGNTVPSQVTGNGPCSGTTMPSDCPYNFYRTSTDIQANPTSWFSNLQTTAPFLGEPPLSRPGSWAYPDMLEVGNLPTFEENRAHFAAWCVVSAPLILSYDVLNANLTEKMWPIIANTELIAINQDWAGHPGYRFYGLDINSVLQIWVKPMTGGDTAVFVIGNSTEPIVAKLKFADYGYPSNEPIYVRDIYDHVTLGAYTGEFETNSIALSDSRFYRLSPHQ
ncbi:Alpha-galactosidase [Diplonema papillatum]|nr:Alpha-galactosidase [Diplonema papillatum]